MMGTSFLTAQTASELLNKVSNTYQNANSYYIKFNMTDNQGSATESGELFAAKEKYSLEIIDIRQMFDGKTLYTITKDDKEVTVSKPDADSNDFLSPTKVLNFYKTNFKAVMDKTETVNGKKVQFLKLTPKEKSEVEYALIGIYTGENTLYQYKEFLTGGINRTITVKEYLENLIIPKALFKFDQSKFEKDGYIVTPI